MRVPNRERGRFSSLSGLSIIKCLGEGDDTYPLIIVDGEGLPVFSVTEWYRMRASDGTVHGTLDTYLGLLLPFAAFLRAGGHAWNAPPDEIRAHLRAFLLRQLHCTVTPDRALEGYRLGVTGATPLSVSGLRGMLAAWRDFYAALAEEGLYVYPNPLESPLLARLRRQRAQHIRNAGAPDIAGIRSVSWRESGCQPSAFFRVKTAEGWRLDPALATATVLEGLAVTFTTMVHTRGLAKRDRIVLLLLRHTGARVHEICGMTAGGYRCHTTTGIPGRAVVRNKGSHGREEKTIYFGAVPQIPRLIEQYVRVDRARADPARRTRLSDLGDDEPLFLTNRGTGYTYEAFKGVWRRLYPHARRHCPLGFSPHDLRHLHVTQLLLKARVVYGREGEGYRSAKESISRLMGWKSPDTIEVYDHTLCDADALELLAAMQRDIVHDVAPAIAPSPTPPVAQRNDDDDDVSGAAIWSQQDDFAAWIGSYAAPDE